MGATLKYICPFNPVAAPVDERIFVSGSISHPGLARWYIEEADINGNGLIENSEMREVRTLGRNFYGRAELPDYLEGLWRFENLEELYLSDSHFCPGKELRVQHDNPMVALVISANPSITILSVARNGLQNSLQRLYIPAGKTKRDYKGSESGELSWLSGIEVINK